MKKTPSFSVRLTILSVVKHGGQTEAENLAYACAICNRNKGSDVGSVLLPSRKFIRFFNPRTDTWARHFKLEGAIIKPLTNIGKVTAQILDFNSEDRLLERRTLISIGRYPADMAKERMNK